MEDEFFSIRYNVKEKPGVFEKTSSTFGFSSDSSAPEKVMLPEKIKLSINRDRILLNPYSKVSFFLQCTLN